MCQKLYQKIVPKNVLQAQKKQIASTSTKTNGEILEKNKGAVQRMKNLEKQSKNRP